MSKFISVIILLIVCIVMFIGWKLGINLLLSPVQVRARRATQPTAVGLNGSLGEQCEILTSGVSFGVKVATVPGFPYGIKSVPPVHALLLGMKRAVPL